MLNLVDILHVYERIVITWALLAAYTLSLSLFIVVYRFCLTVC